MLSAGNTVFNIENLQTNQNTERGNQNIAFCHHITSHCVKCSQEYGATGTPCAAAHGQSVITILESSLAMANKGDGGISYDPAIPIPHT